MKNDLFLNTTKIEIINDNQVIGSGTGFYLMFDFNNDTKIPVLVTNKHVSQGGEKLKFFFHTNKGIKEFIVSSKQFINHSYENIDLSILLIGNFMNELIKKNISVKNKFFLEKDIPIEKSKLNTLEDVLMIGYPIGLIDEQNMLPLIRKGITASNILKNWNGRSEFLIDLACFPGSSGSPVLIFNEGVFSEGSSLTIGTNRMYLLGILYAGPQFKANGEIKIENISLKPKVVINIPMNLGVVIKAERLLDFKPTIMEIIERNKK
jgi:hypothetical protein